MSTPICHDDLDMLRRKRFRVPELFRHGAWLTFPVGQRSEPHLGPSRIRILLWLPIDPPDAARGGAGKTPTWAEVERVIGAPRGGPTSRTAPAEAAGALLQGQASFDGSVEGDQWIIHGMEYPADAFGNIFWKHGWALGTRAGLLVSSMNG
jgi:hypothetical protein